jgi:hypothetical protein
LCHLQGESLIGPLLKVHLAGGRNAGPYNEQDPRHHTQKLKQMLNDTADHAPLDVSKVNDPKAETLFETTAEVLKGLVKAFTDFGEKKEEAWKTAGIR